MANRMDDVENLSKKLDKEYLDVINKYKGKYIAFCEKGVIEIHQENLAGLPRG